MAEGEEESPMLSLLLGCIKYFVRGGPLRVIRHAAAQLTDTMRVCQEAISRVQCPVVTVMT